jgi:DNA-binding SARP family transcriptional activator
MFSATLSDMSAFYTNVPDGPMWPNLEGDSARGAFDLSLHRLRKLLHHKEAIIVSGEKMTLNRDVVWIDVDAFEKLCTLDIPAANASAHRGRLLDFIPGTAPSR